MTQAERRLDEALDILYDYKGNNPYIHMVKRDIYIDKKENSLTDFKVDFILENKDVNPTPINKITKYQIGMVKIEKLHGDWILFQKKLK